MKKISTDPAQRLDIYSREGDKFDKTFTFKNSDESEYDFTGKTLSFEVRKYEGDAALLTLTEGEGITITGGTVELLVTDFSLTKGTYFYVWKIDGEKTWLNGYLHVHNGVFDNFTNTDTITVTENGESVTVTISTNGGNPFTNDDKSKLAGIESGATADQTDVEIKTAYENNDNTNAFTDTEKTNLAGVTPSPQILSDATEITWVWNKIFNVATLTTSNISITLTLSGITAGKNHILSVVKNTASDVTISLTGTDLSFYGYDGADYSNTPNIILSGANGDIFDISFLARTSTNLGISIGQNGN